MAKENNVTKELVEDKAKRDASYEHGKDSPEPIAKGAFSGALASGLSSRFIPPSPKGGSSWKRQAVNLAAGTALGATAGKVYNDKKVDEAVSARKFLGNKNKEREYSKKSKEIYKESSFESTANDAGEVALEMAEDKKPKFRGAKEFATDVGIGSALGGIGGAIFGRKLKLLNAKKLALLGGTQTAASNGLENVVGESDDKATNIATTAGSFAIGGAVEPVFNKAYGRFSKNKDFIDSAKKDSIETGRFGGKNMEAEQITKGHASKGKSAKHFFKGTLKPSLKSAGKWGLAGGAIAYGLGKFTDSMKNRKEDATMKKTAAVNFTANEAVDAETSSAKDEVSKSRVGSIARKAGLAGLGYVVGNRLGGHSAGQAVSGLTLAYSIPKLISEESKRSDAKSFLGKSRHGKMNVIKQKTEDEAFGVSSIAKAYVAIRGIDHVLSPSDKSSTHSEARSRFNLEDHL